MKLEDQVCSLELSRKLKELGVKQESYFWWAKSAIWNIAVRPDGNLFVPATSHSYQFPADQRYSAFTVAELGEMLKGHKFPFWSARYGWETPDNELDGSYYADTEADVRAKMLIYLLENKLIQDEKKI